MLVRGGIHFPAAILALVSFAMLVFFVGCTDARDSRGTGTRSSAMVYFARAGCRPDWREERGVSLAIHSTSHSDARGFFDVA